MTTYDVLHAVKGTINVGLFMATPILVIYWVQTKSKRAERIYGWSAIASFFGAVFLAFLP